MSAPSLHSSIPRTIDLQTSDDDELRWIGAYIRAGALPLTLELIDNKPDETIDEAIRSYYDRLLKNQSAHVNLYIGGSELSIDFSIYERDQHAPGDEWQRLTLEHPQIAHGLLLLLWDTEFNWFLTPWTIAVTARSELLAGTAIIQEKLTALRTTKPKATHAQALDIVETEQPTSRSLARALGRSSLYQFELWRADKLEHTKSLRGRAGRKARQHKPATRDALERFATRCAFTKQTLELINELLEIDRYLPGEDGNSNGQTMPIHYLEPVTPEGKQLLEQVEMTLNDYCENCGQSVNYTDCVTLETFGGHLVALESIKDWLSAAERLMKHISRKEPSNG